MLLFSKFFTRVRERLGGYGVDESSRRFSDERLFEYYTEFRERMNSELGTNRFLNQGRATVAPGGFATIAGGMSRIDSVWLCEDGTGWEHSTRLQPTTPEELESAGNDLSTTGTPSMYYRFLYSEDPYVSGGHTEAIKLYPVPDATCYLEIMGSADSVAEVLSFNTDGSLATGSASSRLDLPEVFLRAAVEHCAYLLMESAEEVPVDHVNRRMQIAESAFRDGMRKWVTQNGGKIVNPYVFPSSSGRVSWP